MNKRLSLLFLTITSFSLFLGAFSRVSFIKAEASNEVEAEIFSVHVRSDGIDNYLVVCDSQMDASSSMAFTTFNDYNAPNYINVYMSPNAEPIKLRDIINSNKWWCNRWSSRGIMFPIDDYDTYNGLSIFAIEILEGCTYPNNNFEKVVVPSTKKYSNDHYLYDGANKEEIKILSVNWSECVDYEKGDTALTISGGHIRSNYPDVEDPELHPELVEYYLDIMSLAFENEPVYQYNSSSLSQINAYSKIILHLNSNYDDEGITLGDALETRLARTNMWTSLSFMFSLSAQEYELYNGTTIYSVEILEDCELIYQNKICRIPQYYKLFNPHYGDPDYKYQNFDLFINTEPHIIDEPISLFGAQVRGQYGEKDEDNLLYINLLSNVYDSTSLLVYPDTSALNAYDMIYIYLSKDDEGVKLGDVAKKYREGVQNQFSAVDNVPGFFFRLGTEEFEMYNGLSIYLIEVLEGCELYVDHQVVVVDKDYRFVNANYGTTFPDTDEGREAKEKAKISGFDFSTEVHDLVNFGNVTMQGIHNRMDKDTESRWLIFLFEDEIYNSSMSVKQFVNKLNFLDNILVYFKEDGEPVKLRDIFDNNAYGDAAGITIAQFGVRNSVGVSITNPKDESGNYINDGPHMYKIVILGGTQIPTMENNVPGYRIIQNKVMIVNDEYGFTGRLPAATRPDYIDEKHRRRTYSDWNINWTVVPCLLTFTVKGISNLEFDEMFLNIGQRVSLHYFDVEGYDLTATTSEGDKIYRCIIGCNRTINVILEYTVHKDQEKEATQSGCGGTIMTTSALLSAIALISTSLIIFKRKED